MFGGLAALPLYLQIVKGVSPTRAGLLLVPLVAGIMVGSIIAGQVISRTGRYRIFPIVGAMLLVVGMALFSQIDVDTHIWVIMLIAPIFGLGLGGNMQPLVLALQNSVPPQDMGVATSSATFFRQMGGTLGTAVFLSVLFSTVGDKIAAAFKVSATTPAFQAALSDPSVANNPNNTAVIKAIKSGAGLPAGALDDTSFLKHLDPRLARPFLIGFSDSIDLVFLCGLGVLAVALVVVFFLPEERLRSVSGIEARRQEANERSAATTSAQGAGLSTSSSQMVDGDAISDDGDSETADTAETAVSRD
jgi:MFS family permease